ncbi:tRNA splicing endonuclease subunit 54 isoform X2 [Musca autumnalis]
MDNLKITEEDTIKVQPKTQYLSSIELTQLRNVDADGVSLGLKRTFPENSEEEKHELEALYDQLQKLLSKPRIERISGRAVAEWDDDAKAVRVVRKDGKFGTFGYSENGELFLEYYEAMFLLEVNRLQLEYHSRILSVEQAYLLLLGENRSSKFTEYLVYSHFTRVGYILVRHQNINFPKYQIETAEDCTWAILEAELQNDTVPDYVKKSAFYAKVRKQFDQIRSDIKNQNNKEDPLLESHDIELNFSDKIKPNLKRKAENDDNPMTADNWKKAKRRRNCGVNVFYKSLVDFLKDEDEYKQFKEQFQQFDIVNLKNYDEDEEENERENYDPVKVETFNINFDVYLHNEGFRKSSPHIPNFRLVILHSHQRFPTHKEMFFTYRQQLNPVPLLLVTVNDSKQIQAFLYYFS